MSQSSPALRELVVNGLAGAFLLGRGRPEGLVLMEDTPEGAWRSFLAAAFCLPAFLAIRLFAWSSFGTPDGGVLRGLSAETIGYVIAWIAFPLASLSLVRNWGRGAEWPRFIAAWNWTNVVQYLVLLAFAVPAALGLVALAQIGSLLGLAYAVWLEWFVARTALRLDNLRAAALVGVDLALGLFIGEVIRALSER